MTNANNINPKDIVETLNGLQNMCNSVLVLYEAHAKGNQELTNLANLTYYLLWNYTKSIIELRLFLNSTLRLEQDLAKGQLCVTINESIKRIIGYKTKDGKLRKNSFWIKEMGVYVSKHPKLAEQYESLKESWERYADSFEKNRELKNIRDITTHGDKNLDMLMMLHNISDSVIIRYLHEWGQYMWSIANIAFTCFENECQQEMNNKYKKT